MRSSIVVLCLVGCSSGRERADAEDWSPTVVDGGPTATEDDSVTLMLKWCGVAKDRAAHVEVTIRNWSPRAQWYVFPDTLCSDKPMGTPGAESVYVHRVEGDGTGQVVRFLLGDCLGFHVPAGGTWVVSEVRVAHCGPGARPDYPVIVADDVLVGGTRVEDLVDLQADRDVRGRVGDYSAVLDFGPSGKARLPITFVNAEEKPITLDLANCRAAEQGG
jgi:hypothetical protein